MLKPRSDALPSSRGDVWRPRLVLILLVLLGAGITIWPVGETLANDAQGAALSTSYTHSLEAQAPEVRTAELQAARAYNAQLQPEALNDPWNVEVRTSNQAHTRYLQTLAGLDTVVPGIPSLKPMARVRVPQISVDLPVFHDADKLTMSYGIGHMYGSSLPAGGPDTHSVLAAHTGLQGRTMFDRLPELEVGQTFFVDVAGQTLTYRIDQMLVVEPWELDAVARIPGGDYVTLVTCYTPPGEHKQRMLVRGVGAPDAPATADAPQTQAAVASAGLPLSIQGWMWPRIAITGGTLIALGAMGVRWSQTDRAHARGEHR